MDAGKLKELRGKADERRKHLSDIFTEAGPDMDMSAVKVIEGSSEEKVQKIRSVNEELDSLATELAPLEAEYSELERGKRSAEEFAGKNGHPLPDPEQEKDAKTKAQDKSIGDLFIESKAGAELKGREVELPDVELKTLFQTSAGWTPETTRTGRLVDFATRPVQVTDVIPHGTTSQAAVVYMEEVTFTNAAAETAEAGEKPEAALKLEEKTSTVRKIAVWLPVTDEQLEDVPQVRNYLNNRLPFMVQQRLDSQILVGNGEESNLKGILNTTNVQTQEKGADPTPDAVFKAMTKVRVTGRAVPNAVILHPNDWQAIRLLRTEDGIYIWGSPSEAGPERIWGLQVVQSDGITENTGLVGDFANFSELTVRRGISVEVSDSHSDFFIKNKQAIRAEMRAALVVYRPTAFCKVTGI